MDQQVIDHARQLRASLERARSEAANTAGAVSNPQHGFLLNILEMALNAFLEQLAKQG